MVGPPEGEKRSGGRGEHSRTTPPPERCEAAKGPRPGSEERKQKLVVFQVACRSVHHIQHTEKRETRKKRNPEEDVSEDFVSTDHWDPSYRNHWDLDELHVEREWVPSDQSTS